MTQTITDKKIFITGGAGFIGSRLVRKLCQNGAGDILVYDNLHPQVHGEGADFPRFSARVSCTRGAVEDLSLMQSELASFDPDIVVHLAAETGTGQSQDEIVRYATANVTGTANLLQAIGTLPERERVFLLSSSRAIYGEGPHRTEDGVFAMPRLRSDAAMRGGDFNVYDSEGGILSGIPADNARPDPLSVYASTKLIQEHLLLNCTGPKNLAPRILRFQNVYGPGQSLHNPYTGVLSIFTAQIIAGKVLDLYEDGGMIRDFVFVDDVVDACFAALCCTEALDRPIDIGSGEDKTIGEVAAELLDIFDEDPDQMMTVSGKFRPGDIRYACADITAAQELLNWSPKISLREGLTRLVAWARETASDVRKASGNARSDTC